MKRLLACCVAAFMTLTLAAQTKEKKTAGGVEKAITGLEQKWVEAAKASNPDLIAPYLSDKLMNTGSDGKVNGKKETLASIKGSKWEKTELSHVKVTVFGDTAIATGDWEGKGTDENGKPVDTHERWTDTWMKMAGGKWQCIASHGSTVKM